jgi:hypothetical protein
LSYDKEGKNECRKRNNELHKVDEEGAKGDVAAVHALLSSITVKHITM